MDLRFGIQDSRLQYGVGFWVRGFRTIKAEAVHRRVPAQSIQDVVRQSAC